jgi:hypothetical protein
MPGTATLEPGDDGEIAVRKLLREKHGKHLSLYHPIRLSRSRNLIKRARCVAAEGYCSTHESTIEQRRWRL